MSPLQEIREMFIRGEINRDSYTGLIRYHDYIVWMGDHQELLERRGAVGVSVGVQD